MKKIFKNRPLFAFFVILIVVAGYFGYRSLAGNSTVAPQYVTAKVQRGTLVVSVTGSGQIAASNQINVQPKVAGTVVKIPVANNQPVKAGDILIKLDTTDNERAVRNTETSLENAKLSLASLLEPPTTSTLLQAQQSVVQAQQSLLTNQNNLITDYANAYTDISNTFVDLPGVMTGLNGVLYNSVVNKPQTDIDAYVNLANSYNSNAYQYGQNAVAGYQMALTAYNQSLADFKNSTINSSTSTIEALLAETYSVLKTISIANSNVKNFLDLVNNTLQQVQQKAPSQLSTDVANMLSYISTTNSHLSTILQIQNAIQSDKQSIVTATLSSGQTAAALDQLQSGPTELQVQTQNLAIAQAENALYDAQQNLADDQIRAPFDGIVTNITAKVGQTAGAGTAVAVLVSNAQLAQATFNEVDIVNVKVGQQATITFDALPNLTLTGKVSQVDTIGTVSQGVVSYNVQVSLDVPSQQVKPGMSDGVSIITSVKQDVLTVPNSAVTTKQGVSTVQVMQSNGVPNAVEVTTGLANDSITEIVSGLNEGDAVVTRTTTKSASTQTQTTSGLGGIRIPGLGGGHD